MESLFLFPVRGVSFVSFNNQFHLPLHSARVILEKSLFHQMWGGFTLIHARRPEGKGKDAVMRKYRQG